MLDTEFIKLAIASTFTNKEAEKMIANIERIETIQLVKDEYFNRPADVGGEDMILQLAEKYHLSTSAIEKYIYVQEPKLIEK